MQNIFFLMGAIIDLVKGITVFVKSYYATYFQYIQSSQGSNVALFPPINSLYN